MPREIRDEFVGERQNILAPVAQGGDIEFDDVEAII